MESLASIPSRIIEEIPTLVFPRNEENPFLYFLKSGIRRGIMFKILKYIPSNLKYKLGGILLTLMIIFSWGLS